VNKPSGGMYIVRSSLCIPYCVFSIDVVVSKVKIEKVAKVERVSFFFSTSLATFKILL